MDRMAETAQIHPATPILFRRVVEGMIRVNAQAVRRMFDTLGGAGLQGCLEEQCAQLDRNDNNMICGIPDPPVGCPSRLNRRGCSAMLSRRCSGLRRAQALP